MPVRVVLADDHVLVRQGLRALLEREGFQVAGEASDGQEAIRVATAVGPDIAILDVSMPMLNGLEAARELYKRCRRTKTILLTRHDEDQYVTEALRAGVKGYVLKNQMATDLVQATVRVAPGDILVFTTDGIRTGFSRELVRTLPPQRAAESILAGHGKITDDALVLVAKYLGKRPGTTRKTSTKRSRRAPRGAQPGPRSGKDPAARAGRGADLRRA